MSAILRNRLYIKKSKVNQHQLKSFQYVLQDGYTKEAVQVNTYKIIEQRDNIGFHRGDLSKIFSLFEDEDIKDKRDCVLFPYPLEFTGKYGKGYDELRPEQREAIKKWISFGYGQLKAPPRWGKTVAACALLTTLKQKALILLHTIDLVNQFEEEIRTWTNIEELEEKHNKKLVGVLKGGIDTFFPMITLSTWQYLYNNLYILNTRARPENKTGLVLIDEVHKVSAKCYADVVSNTNSLYRLGITATPFLKSGLEVIVNDVIGPVVVESDVEKLPVKSIIHFTDCTILVNQWTTLLNVVGKHEERNKYIAKCVLKDVMLGHTVLVTSDRIKQCKDIKKYLEDLDETLNIEIIIGQTSEKKRKEIREDAKTGKLNVVIAMNNIIQLGWNVPRVSSLHNCLPMINEQNWYQRISRVRTPYLPTSKKDTFVKPDPVAHIYVDDYIDESTLRPADGIRYGYINTIKKVAALIKCPVVYSKRKLQNTADTTLYEKLYSDTEVMQDYTM